MKKPSIKLYDSLFYIVMIVLSELNTAAYTNGIHPKNGWTLLGQNLQAEGRLKSLPKRVHPFWADTTV